MNTFAVWLLAASVCDEIRAMSYGEFMRREKCSYADKYQAIRAPTCGCRWCAEKWEAKQRS